ncbi:MAG: HDOD domain-containing protein [Methylophaga sp.]|nr:HDOD domain-containing protein [Methylophaga sp.]
MVKENNKIDAWIQQLTDEDMPVFAGTVTSVTEAVNNDDTSAADVAQTILKDASLTGRLLKMANSFYYNPNGHKINTITRSVMVLGFDQVRALALSLVLVDALSDGVHREKITEEMAQSFHAAIQAQALAKRTKSKSPENIFVATLLSRLGNMAFWAFSGDKAKALCDLMESEGLSENDAEKEVLGFHLHDLTIGLSKSWALGELLDMSLSGNYHDDSQVELIDMGHDLAQTAKNGWEEEDAQLVIERVAGKLKLPVPEAEKFVHENAKQAKEITKMYGVTEASQRIPQANVILIDGSDSDLEPEMGIEETEKETLLSEHEAPSTVEEQEIEIVDTNSSYPEPDTDKQLMIMQEITEVMEEKPSINVIFEMVLEGLYHGVGMDRSLFAILSEDHKTLRCKYALGEDNERLMKEFNIDVSHSSNIFHQAVTNKKAVHIPEDPKKLAGTLTRDMLKLLGPPPYLIMPTIVRGKVIGVFIADRNASKRQIEAKDFLAFQQFCQQANMGLTFLTMQG